MIIFSLIIPLHMIKNFDVMIRYQMYLYIDHYLSSNTNKTYQAIDIFQFSNRILKERKSISVLIAFQFIV